MKAYTLKPANIVQPLALFDKQYSVFRRNPIKLLDKHVRWRKLADLYNISPKAKLRLEWIIFYETVSDKNITCTCKHFNISRKIFYKWLERFNQKNQDPMSLESVSTRPHNVRKREISEDEKTKVITIRKEYMYWGKHKLKAIYKKRYGEVITTWKIECVIREFNLFPDKKKHEKIVEKRKANQNKKRIQQLERRSLLWYLLQLDGITIHWNGLKRYIFTAIDNTGKLAFARMYKHKSSRAAKDFLFRLKYFINEPIENLQTDNGSEFAGEFEKACHDLKIDRYFSRARTPQDNSEVERFNQTLEYEWLNHGNFNPDTKVFNKRLTSWLIEYNFQRPHQSLDYLTPIEYIEKHTKVLPMYSARTAVDLFNN